MAVPKQINSKYSAIIFEDPEDGLIKLRAFASGSIRPSGLNVSGKVTEVTLNSTTWTALPATPLTDRNAIAVQNESGIDIKVNYDSTVGYIGMLVVDGQERQYDVTDNIILYARSASGTPSVSVEELA